MPERTPPSRLRLRVAAGSCSPTSRAPARTTGTAAAETKDGNTEVLARAISARLDCDVQRIVQEQDTDARPAIANPLASIDAYDTFVLASPIWNVQALMIMTTFAER